MKLYKLADSISTICKQRELPSEYYYMSLRPDEFNKALLQLQQNARGYFEQMRELYSKHGCECVLERCDMYLQGNALIDAVFAYSNVPAFGVAIPSVQYYSLRKEGFSWFASLLNEEEQKKASKEPGHFSADIGGVRYVTNNYGFSFASRIALAVLEVTADRHAERMGKVVEMYKGLNRIAQRKYADMHYYLEYRNRVAEELERIADAGLESALKALTSVRNEEFSKPEFTEAVILSLLAVQFRLNSVYVYRAVDPFKKRVSTVRAIALLNSEPSARGIQMYREVVTVIDADTLLEKYATPVVRELVATGLLSKECVNEWLKTGDSSCIPDSGYKDLLSVLLRLDPSRVRDTNWISAQADRAKAMQEVITSFDAPPLIMQTSPDDFVRALLTEKDGKLKMTSKGLPYLQYIFLIAREDSSVEDDMIENTTALLVSPDFDYYANVYDMLIPSAFGLGLTPAQAFNENYGLPCIFEYVKLGAEK